MQLLFVLVLLAGSTGLPVQDGAAHHAIEGTFLRSLPLEREIQPPKWKKVYVNKEGVVDITQSTFRSTQVEVAGSPHTSQRGLHTAAQVVGMVVKYMPSDIFTQLVKNGSVGVFTAAEKLIVYPEYYYLANGNCGTSCVGACAHTCSTDGRKIQDVAGYGGKRAVILEDNLLCTEKDPYKYLQNILVHELAHTIHQYAVPSKVKQEITAAYNNAKSKGIWEKTSYALTSELEYFAEAAAVFLHVNKNNDTSGGMANCKGKVCPSLKDVREYLRDKDPNLYKILNLVFNNNQSKLDSAVGQNVALVGNTTQSSTYAVGGVSSVAVKAIDGDKSGDFKTGGCSHTNRRDKKPNLNLTFANPVTVKTVVLYNRLDSDSFIVRGFSGDNRELFRFTDTNPISQPVYTVNLDEPVSGVAKVNVEATRKGFYGRKTLALCELEVFGE